ncbi:AAA family ATPase [Streptomyces sp. NBC_01618]|uniref:AAA family ATPase n=1 Tax=Streptomyces sp. NBC_01618 TaxID=2975900 RepID=UPI00386C760E
MYLGRVRAKGFKSLLDMDVPLRQGVTVVVGENNAGKSNFIDVLRLLTDPLDGRRSRWWEAEDVHPWAESGAELTAVYGGLTPAEAGHPPAGPGAGGRGTRTLRGPPSPLHRAVHPAACRCPAAASGVVGGPATG